MAKMSPVQKEIARRNKIFSKATPAQKRVLVAQDVLEQIRIKKFVPNTGSWLTSHDNRISNPHLYDSQDISLQEELLNPNSQKCEGCALGGLFLSCTLYNNHVTPGNLYKQIDKMLEHVKYDEEEKPDNGLVDIFDKNDLAAIEMCFEGGYGAIRFDDFAESNSSLSDDDFKLIRRWHSFATPKKRIVTIMNNIIKHKGEFILVELLKTMKRQEIAAMRKWAMSECG